MDSNTYLDAFIDTELQKRRGGMAETAESHQSAQQPSPDFKSKRDRLYEIPEHLRVSFDQWILPCVLVAHYWL